MQQDSSQKTIIIATLSFIVGFGLAWFIAINKDVSKETLKTGKQTVGAEVSLSSPNFILVRDQVEGVRVTLEKVVLENPGWAVIHEDDGGKPGRILGAQLFDKGTTEAPVVDLLRGTLAGGTYYAMLHADNGDRAFDPKNDKPLVGEDGNVVMSTFKVTASQETQ